MMIQTWTISLSANGELCPNYSSWYLNAFDNNFINTDTIPRGINIYFTEDSIVYQKYWVTQNLNDTSGYIGTDGACSQFPTTSNLTRTSRIHMPDCYSKLWYMKNIVPQLAVYHYYPWNNIIKQWYTHGLGITLAHELGHSFNLYHPSENPLFYPNVSCSSTIMNPAGGGNYSHDFLPPIEIGIMYMSTMSTNLQTFIPLNTYLGTKNINAELTFPKIRFYHSLNINELAEVTFPCEMTMPKQTYITINSGAILNIDGGYIHSAEDKWNGIIVKGGGILILSSTSIDDYNIIVEYGGSVIIKNSFAITGDNYLKVKSGGYICISEDAQITLQDEFSIMDISPNAIWGSLQDNTTCLQSLSYLQYFGAGHIVSYNMDDYIQNITISTDYFSSGSIVMAGYNVTNQKPNGNVTVTPNGHLRIVSDGNVILTRNVEIQQGGVLEIK